MPLGNKTWFLSDPHFSHKRILEYENRPFLDTEHMDSVLIENFNNIVQDGDTVFWLGDMFFCNSQRIEYICKRLKLDRTRNFIIRGNHDNRVSDTKFKRLGFMPYKIYLYGRVMLTHQPMTPQNIEWLKYMYSSAVLGNLHGHTHSLDTGLDPTRWQCVSVEKTDYKPISYLDAIERFKDGEAWSEWSNKTNGKNLYFEQE